MGRFIDITGAPIASDFQEMPLDFMSKALDVKQKSLDTFRSDADKGIPVDTGLRTEWVKKYADETYTPELERIAKNAVANPQGASRELTSLRTKMAKDPFISKAKQDAAAKDFVTKNEYTLKQEGKPILDYRDAQGNIIQMSKEDLLNKDFDLGTWYDATGYGDYIKEIRDKFSKSLPEKGKYVRDILPGLQDFTSRGLGQLMSQGKTITEVDRREIKELNDDIDAEFRRLMNDGGKDARYFRKEHGLKQGDMSEATEKFVKNNVLLPEAKTFMYNWDSTVTDMNYSAPPSSGDGDGKKKGFFSVPMDYTDVSTPEDFNNKIQNNFQAKAAQWVNLRDKVFKDNTLIKQGPGGTRALTEGDLPRLEAYYKNLALNGKGADKFDAINKLSELNSYNTLRKDELDFREKLSKEFSDNFNKLTPQEQTKYKGYKESVIKDINTLNKEIDPNKYIINETVTYGGNPTTKVDTKIKDLIGKTTKDLSTKETGVIKPAYSLNDITGDTAGIIQTLDKAITSSIGQNRKVFAGMSQDLKPDEFIKDKLNLDSDGSYKLTNVSVDKTGNLIVSYSDAKNPLNSVAMKLNRSSEFDYHRDYILRGLKNTQDGNAHSFANRGLFIDNLMNSGMYGQYVDLQTRPTGQLPVEDGILYKRKGKNGEPIYFYAGKDVPEKDVEKEGTLFPTLESFESIIGEIY